MDSRKKPKAKGLLERPLPLQLPETSLGEARAIKALAKGEATEMQQVLAYNYIWRKLGMVGGLSFIPESDGVTSFNEGRRFVGISLINLVETPIEILKRTT